jgi:hypothetical protein
MTISALSRTCHHSNGLDRVTLASGEVGSHIVGILHTRLLERVLQAPICTMKTEKYTS